jgi:pyrophosphatase PpaX
MIKAILFDLDGTLINTNNLIMQSFKHAFKTYLNRDIEESEIVKFFGVPLEKAVASFGEENAEGIIKAFREFNEEKHDELAEGFEGIEEALKSLKAMGLSLGIVTSKRQLMAHRSLKLINIFDYMDVIITPEDTDKHKPDPDPIFKACEVLKVSPAEIIMVGDSIYDIQCGINAGSETCAVTYTEFAMDEIKELNPQYIVDNIMDLVDIISNSKKIVDKKELN